MRLVALFLILLAAYAATINVPARPGVDYAGSEPHHLLAAESIVSDHDVNLADEYRERAYASWYPRELKTGRLAVRASEEAVQIHGGYGYIEEYPVCRMYRDAKILTIGEGTDEVQQMVIARALGA